MAINNTRAISTSSLSNYVTFDDLADRLKSYITARTVATSYVNKESMKDYAKKDELSIYLPKKELSSAMTKCNSEISRIKIDLSSNYLLKRELSSIVNQYNSEISRIKSKISILSNLPSDIVSETELSNILKSYVSLSVLTKTYATKEQLNDYVLEDELENYITETELSSKLKNYDLEIIKINNNLSILNRIPTNIITETDLNNKLKSYPTAILVATSYVNKESMKNYVRDTDLSAYITDDEYRRKINQYDTSFEGIKNELSIINKIPESYKPECIDDIIDWNKKLTSSLKAIKNKLPK